MLLHTGWISQLDRRRGLTGLPGVHGWWLASKKSCPVSSTGRLIVFKSGIGGRAFRFGNGGRGSGVAASHTSGRKCGLISAVTMHPFFCDRPFVALGGHRKREFG
jgi:hypothetical protein